MKTFSLPRSSRAFTLIELLVVISIIGILMALLFPAVGGAIDSAKKAQAKNDAVQISNAIIAYEVEYGRLPVFGGGGGGDFTGNVSGELLKALRATTTDNNPRKIVFLDVRDLPASTTRITKSGVKGDQFVDPWGSAYRVAIDGDYNNELASAGSSPGPTTTAPLKKKVAVWNDVSGMPGNPSAALKKRRAVVSWE